MVGRRLCARGGASPVSEESTRLPDDLGTSGAPGGNGAGAASPLAASQPLERLLRPLDAPEGMPALDRGADAAGEAARPRLQLTSGDWHLFVSEVDVDGGAGAEITSFSLPNGTTVAARLDDDTGAARIPFSLEDALRGYLAEEWTSAVGRRGLSPRQLDFYYRARGFLPRPLQIAARRLLIRRQGVPDFPRWPLDLSVPRLLRFYARCLLLATGRDVLPFSWFWPGAHSAAIILTHDVESAEGLTLALEIADLEEELGFRSSFNLGAWYTPDPGLLRELRDRGFEIGVHGIRHDRSLFASRTSFDFQRPKLLALAEELGAEGFRSPSTHRVFDWFAELPFSYDCSIPNSDPFEPQPGGCCTVWPFFIGSLVELPYTLPQDHTLFTLLGRDSVDVWVESALRLEEEHGLIQCITHPDPGYLGDPGHRALYVEFLRRMAERSDVWRALPSEVAAWWRARDAGDDPRISTGTAYLDGGAVALRPPGAPA
jgi:hypothetical protein